MRRLWWQGRLRQCCGVEGSEAKAIQWRLIKLEIEVNLADDAADKVEYQEHLRKKAILALFADRKITAGKAAHELGLERLHSWTC